MKLTQLAKEYLVFRRSHTKEYAAGEPYYLHKCQCGGRARFYPGLDDVQIACERCNNRTWPSPKPARACYEWNNLTWSGELTSSSPVQQPIQA